jgi:uncharacterized protein (UPF0264 family)
MNQHNNRKLLVSVFNAQEAREAVLGGGRIIDSEDPKSALGNIKPRHIMAVSDAVLDFSRDLELQLSTNIGEDQLLFRRDDNGQAVEKSPYEIAGKAAQAAIGVAASMGTRVHPVNIVKVGLDGMRLDMLVETLTEVVLTLQRTEHFSNTQVMSVLFAQDLARWHERKSLLRRELVELREFGPAHSKEDSGAFSLLDGWAVKTLRGANGKYLFEKAEDVTLPALIESGVLPASAKHAFVVVNELFAHGEYFGPLAEGDRTTRKVIAAMVDATADAGAHAMMLDTSILSKVCDICLVDTAGSEMIDFNPLYVRNGLPRTGILKLDDLRFFVDYCHYRGIVANLAGSLDSYQAQMLWALIPELDQLSVRGHASRVSSNPAGTGTGSDTRQSRTIYRNLVRGLAPPEHGGVLNVPTAFAADQAAAAQVQKLRRLIEMHRQTLGLPRLEAYWVDARGSAIAMN